MKNKINVDIKKNELIKHSGAIHIYGDLNITQRKVSNILLKNAFSDLLKKSKHSISISSLMREIGYNSNNIDFLKSTVTSLMGTIVDWNILNKDNKNEWVASSIIASIKIKHGTIEYSYSQHLKELLANPNIFAKLNLVIQRAFKSVYSLILWEYFVEILCSYNKEEIETPWMELADFRKLMGLKENEHKQFKMLNFRLINEPLKEINSVSDIEVTSNYKKEGRKVVAISFSIKRKQSYQYNIGFDNIKEKPQTIVNTYDIDTNELLNTLKQEFSISDKKAQKIIKTYEQNKIEKALMYVRKKIAEGTKIRSIAAFTVKAIDEEWLDNDINENELLNNKTKQEILEDIQNIINNQSDKRWSTVLRKLHNQYGDGTFNGWFSKISFISFEESTLFLSSPTKFISQWLENNYAQSIIEYWNEEKSENVKKIEFVLINN